MSAARLRAEAEAAGVSLTLVGGEVRLAAAAAPAPELLAKLREHKAEIVALLAAPPWTDDREWCRRLSSAGDKHSRRIALRQWAAAAGGWSDAGAVYLPVSLRPGMALADMKSHARALGLAVREDHDDPEMTAWLRGAKP